MIVGIGIDLAEVDRIRAIYERHRERFLNRILTEQEQEYVLRYRDPAERMAGRWAVKEAAFKALGTGLAQGIRWRDVEVVRTPAGKPELVLHARALELARDLEANRFHVTVTHSQTLAMAQVILERI